MYVRMNEYQKPSAGRIQGRSDDLGGAGLYSTFVCLDAKRRISDWRGIHITSACVCQPHLSQGCQVHAGTAIEVNKLHEAKKLDAANQVTQHQLGLMLSV